MARLQELKMFSVYTLQWNLHNLIIIKKYQIPQPAFDQANTCILIF